MKLKNNYNINILKLEKLSLRHLKDIHEYSSDPKFFKNLEFIESKKLSETRKYLKKRISENDFKKNFWWAIKHVREKKAIGTFVIHDLNLERMNCEISYGISPNYQNKGFFKLIVKKMIKVLLKKKIVRIQAITSIRNKASINGLKKCGFKIEGTLRKYYKSIRNKKSYNALILSIIKK
tara:strand:+ start:2287 stop:2823 length:537 start_codon:yes stop_codon:yes gene_type:complete